MHEKAKEVDKLFFDDVGKQLHFIYFISAIYALFSCEDCKGHMRQYLLDNPLPQAQVRTAETSPFFEYMNTFHNSVNRRLGKREISLAEARRMFGVCDEDGGCPVDSNNTDSITTTRSSSFQQDTAFITMTCITGAVWIALLGTMVWTKTRER